MRSIHTFEEKYLEAVSSHRSASSHSRRLFIEQLIFPQRALGLRPIRIFWKGYLEAVSSRRSASSHSRGLFVERFIFLQCVLGYKTHLLEIYTLFAALTPYFFYLCYSLKPTARGEWPGHISGRWRGFLQGIDQKLKAGGAFRGVSTKSRRQSGINVFQDTSPKAGGTFCGVLAKSRRLSGAALFRAIAAGHLSGFPQRIDQKPKADGRKHFSGVHLRRLAGLFAEYRPKVKGYLEQLFFGSSQRVSGEIFRKGLTKSWKLSGATLFRVIAAARWRDFPKRIDQKPEAVWSYTFSSHRSRPLERPRGRWEKAAGSGRALKLF